MSPEYQDLMPLDEAAEFLDLSKRVLAQKARDGIVPAKKIGRKWWFSISALEADIQEDSQRAPAITSESFDSLKESEAWSLASHYIDEVSGLNRMSVKVDVKIYEHYASPRLVILSQRYDVLGHSLTNSIEYAATSVREKYLFSSQAVWIQHDPERRQANARYVKEETFMEVKFGSESINSVDGATWLNVIDRTQLERIICAHIPLLLRPPMVLIDDYTKSFSFADSEISCRIRWFLPPNEPCIDQRTPVLICSNFPKQSDLRDNETYMEVCTGLATEMLKPHYTDDSQYMPVFLAHRQIHGFEHLKVEGAPSQRLFMVESEPVSSEWVLALTGVPVWGEGAPMIEPVADI